MIRNCVALILLLSATILSACIGRPANVQSTSTDQSKVGRETTDAKREPERAETVLVDATGSYDQLVPALRRLERFAGEELNAGDTFCAFWIKGGIGEAPDFIVRPTTLPVPRRRIGDPAELRTLEIKRTIQKAFSDYADVGKFKKAGETDLLQAISTAGRLLQSADNNSREKWLLMFTDLEDNKNRHVDLHLEGVHVRVFYVPARNDLKDLDSKVSAWKERLNRAKVASIQIYDVGQTEMLPRLIGRN